MNNFLTAIANAVLPQQQEYSAESLQALVLKYPYASALQLLLSAEMEKSSDPGFKDQWQKTLLYFNNPLLIQHQFLAKDTAATSQNTAVAKEDLTTGVETSSVSMAQEAPVKIPGLKIERADPAKTELLFTPYYTVDYFASQGIKLNDEINSGDQFGNQLKSFTSWLKEMRRLPEAGKTDHFNLKTEAVIEKMAENSLHGENEDTAAMAEVWAKQGNTGKAIEIYQKLSLQIPSKRAYFAAKIEYLKKKTC